MEVHDKLKFFRIFKGWSQEELADKLGLSPHGYAKIERGETDINLSRLQQIAEVMGINLKQLFGIDDRTIFNVIDSCTSLTNTNHGSVVLSQTECAHELEKARLLVEGEKKEIAYLKEIIDLMKRPGVLLEHGTQV